MTYFYQGALNLRNELSEGIAIYAKNSATAIPQGVSAAGNSQKKRFWADHGLVIASRLQGAIDFPREESSMNRLGSAEQGGWFSYQKRVSINPEEEDAALIATFDAPNLWDRMNIAFTPTDSTVRQFSLYERPTDFNDPNQDIELVPKLDQWVINNTGHGNHIKAANLQCCIHQIMHIHYLLFLHQWVHGDMHMKNIKVIDPSRAVGKFLVKAFDWGNASSAGMFNRYNDLNYLFYKKSQKIGLIGHFETKSRHKRETRGTDEERENQKKHYPLHKLLEASGISEANATAQLETIGRRLMGKINDNNRYLQQPWVDASNDLARLVV